MWGCSLLPTTYSFAFISKCLHGVFKVSASVRKLPSRCLQGALSVCKPSPKNSTHALNNFANYRQNIAHQVCSCYTTKFIVPFKTVEMILKSLVKSHPTHCLIQVDSRFAQFWMVVVVGVEQTCTCNASVRYMHPPDNFLERCIPNKKKQKYKQASAQNILTQYNGGQKFKSESKSWSVFANLHHHHHHHYPSG